MKWSTEKRKVRDLIPYTHNPRRLTDKQAKDLEKSLKKFNLVEIPAINTDNVLIAGHQRVAILGTLGRLDDEIDVRVPDRTLTEAELKEYNVRSNKNTGEWDFDILANAFSVADLVEWGFKELELGTVAGWNPEKTFDDKIGDGINELTGYGLQSFWKDIKNENCPVFPLQLELPVQAQQNLVRQKYSRTNLDEIQRVVKTYMRPGDYFLESCVGWGTFSSVAKFNGYSGVGTDIWDVSLEHSKKQLERVQHDTAKVKIEYGDAMALPFKDDTFDYVYCNPPFMDEETYSGSKEDLGTKDHDEFAAKFIKLMQENYRVVKPNGLCTITINDKREKGLLVPLQAKVIEWGTTAGFGLHDFVVAEVLSQKIRLRKKDYAKRRTVKCHEYVITFIKPLA